MGDTDTCLSLKGLVGFLSSENGRPFPRSQPDPTAVFIAISLSVILSSLSHPFSLFLHGQFLFIMFSSLSSDSDLLASIWLYTRFIPLHVSLSLPSDPSAFHLSPDRKLMIMAMMELWWGGRAVNTYIQFSDQILWDCNCCCIWSQGLNCLSLCEALFTHMLVRVGQTCILTMCKLHRTLQITQGQCLQVWEDELKWSFMGGKNNSNPKVNFRTSNQVNFFSPSWMSVNTTRLMLTVSASLSVLLVSASFGLCLVSCSAALWLCARKMWEWHTTVYYVE